MCQFPLGPTRKRFFIDQDFFGKVFSAKENVGWSCNVSSLKLTASLPLKMDGWNTTVLFFRWPVFRCELLVSRRVAWLNKPCDFEDSGVISSFRIGKLHENPYRPVFSLLNRVDMLTATDRKGGGFTPLNCEDGPTFRARWCSVKIPQKNWGRLNPAISCSLDGSLEDGWFSLLARDFFSKSAAKQIQVEIVHVTSILYTFA